MKLVRSVLPFGLHAHILLCNSVVREINKINQRELDLGLSGASWHDEYKDSAYIYIGGLNYELTEGDIITIFSQYGEPLDVNLVRDKETGKSKGFAFLMYEDQRSTVLAVDNLNGAQVLNRTLRVDHVRDYKQKKVKGEDGELVDPEEQSLNAKPELIVDHDASSESSVSSGPEIDPEDPMYEYLVAQRREEKTKKKAKKAKGKSKHKDETPEERRARKERKRAKKARKQLGKSDALKGVEELLQDLDRRGRAPPRDDVDEDTRSRRPRDREAPARLHSRSRSQSPSYRPSKRRRSPSSQPQLSNERSLNEPRERR
ncbi:hypothetical protein PUNSTDRAFT_63827 [Punctularia strigosozonata HHB-11173 SS5]|uniref:uncharacterized protein n=1 Tax=Punctularia strigosozonata (strain HHB-11173) TaxID=741275 RepID=UPI0004418102|nr:uncharacterized protein PUNSTDRAFT_63827 [Punctularia strigosozonata HHB-11173 SS5]EIN10977.1 hypothetical protein PUNSTDRAFT_63827 [Punctularia strigosozonata HHB-11173 SS5]